jgi:hypothetical protein
MKAKRKPAIKAKPPKNANAPTAEFYRKLGEAYREQEDGLGDLLIMSELAATASISGDEGERVFTAHHLRDMINDFRQEWYDRHKEAQSKAEAVP